MEVGGGTGGMRATADGTGVLRGMFQTLIVLNALRNTKPQILTEAFVR